MELEYRNGAVFGLWKQLCETVVRCYSLYFTFLLTTLLGRTTQLPADDTITPLTRTSVIQLPRESKIFVRTEDGKEKELFVAWADELGPLALNLIPICGELSA